MNIQSRTDRPAKRIAHVFDTQGKFATNTTPVSLPCEPWETPVDPVEKRQGYYLEQKGLKND